MPHLKRSAQLSKQTSVNNRPQKQQKGAEKSPLLQGHRRNLRFSPGERQKPKDLNGTDAQTQANPTPKEQEMEGEQRN